MGANILDILNNATLAQAGNSEEYQDITLDFSEIVVTKHNKYSMSELQEMATGLLIGGLQQPLVIGRVDGAYWLVSGHRRIAGIEILLSEGHEEFRNIPCRCKDMSKTEFRIALLVGNTFNRRMTDYDLMVQAQEWKEVLTQARKDGDLKLDKGERVRDYVAVVLGESAGKIGTLEAINNQATPEVKEQFQNGNMGITAAAAAATLPEEQQKEIAAQVAAGQDIKAEEIKAIAEEKKGKKKKTVEEQQREQNVSDTDTTEEEKANAAKLHVLKMLGNYYTWMNEEEKGILERILEDCKRRKREYALPMD
ncbi:ParB N-terminal domain-containing protein [Eisenbergiella porci]|uniref:ParB N-terminal domain-containing protein n=1 Tax=Eisenbergiella porci TaxID=2652274 RepID=UPI002A90DCE6|nr:ParB N-terminal domain-containing protein [Eisenbergiella porci]MDY5528739.1 ParB N-terminal domain-containing protein [Eisenbergiella porci]